jgi:hypothetical protein
MRAPRIVLALAGVALLAACQDGPTAGRQDVIEQPTVPSGEIRTGWIIGPNGGAVEVQYTVYRGRGIFEGDIDLGPVDEIPATREALLGGPGPRRGVVIDGSNYRWPSGVVYYTIGTEFTTGQRGIIRSALNHINLRARGIKFYEGTAANRIHFNGTGTGCSSPVGRQGGVQNISLGSGCVYMGIVAHEVLHSLGMHHEHSRCDRESYVEILSGNIQSGKASNFNRMCDGETDLRTYDVGSIMHYGPRDFGIVVGYGDTLQTIRSRIDPALEAQMGQRTGLSSTDASTLATLYPPPTPTYVSGLRSPPVNTLQTYTVVPESGVTASLVQWYKDRSPVATTMTYTFCVRGPFELLVDVWDVYGNFTQGYLSAYPSYSGGNQGYPGC